MSAMPEIEHHPLPPFLPQGGEGADAGQFSASSGTVVYGFLLSQSAERYVAHHGAGVLRRQDALRTAKRQHTLRTIQRQNTLGGTKRQNVFGTTKRRDSKRQAAQPQEPQDGV